MTCPGRNFTILRIETDQGLVGYGDGTLNGRELPVASSGLHGPPDVSPVGMAAA